MPYLTLQEYFFIIYIIYTSIIVYEMSVPANVIP